MTETDTFRVGDRLVSEDGTRRAVVEAYSPCPGWLWLTETTGRRVLSHSSNWRRA